MLGAFAELRKITSSPPPLPLCTYPNPSPRFNRSRTSLGSVFSFSFHRRRETLLPTFALSAGVPLFFFFSPLIRQVFPDLIFPAQRPEAAFTACRRGFSKPVYVQTIGILTLGDEIVCLFCFHSRTPFPFFFPFVANPFFLEVWSFLVLFLHCKPNLPFSPEEKETPYSLWRKRNFPFPVQNPNPRDPSNQFQTPGSATRSGKAFDLSSYHSRYPDLRKVNSSRHLRFCSPLGAYFPVFKNIKRDACSPLRIFSWRRAFTPSPWSRNRPSVLGPISLLILFRFEIVPPAPQSSPPFPCCFSPFLFSPRQLFFPGTLFTGWHLKFFTRISCGRHFLPFFILEHIAFDLRGLSRPEVYWSPLAFFPPFFHELFFCFRLPSIIMYWHCFSFAQPWLRRSF